MRKLLERYDVADSPTRKGYCDVDLVDARLGAGPFVAPVERMEIVALRINDEAPNFKAETTQGPIDFHEWIGDGWAILFSHPKDFTPVCTTELGYMAGLQPEFDKRNCKILAISVDGVSDHERWLQDIETSQGHRVNYPLIGDPQLEVVKLYDMLPADAGETCAGRTPADNATARAVSSSDPTRRSRRP